MPDAANRTRSTILTAELLSIGTEITVGETRDTNAGELAAQLTREGVRVTRITALPDRLDAVTAGFADGLARADLVVSTGGLGPTPDDLTREAIAAVCGEVPAVDAELEAWLRGLWARRTIPFPPSNIKQAWLIPSATALPNPNGTAPGWLVRRAGGGVIVALPGPPREMRPMWADHALPALRSTGLGADVAAQTFRLTGIGESQVAEILGEGLLRQQNPEVATYARAEAVDVRVSAVGPGPDGASAAAMVDEVAAIVRERLGQHIWATGDTTYAGAVGDALRARGWRLAVSEIGTRGQVAATFGDVEWLAYDEIRASDAVLDAADPTGEEAHPGSGAAPLAPGSAAALLATARRVRDAAGADVGLAVRARERGSDTAVSFAVVTPTREHTERRMAFLGGAQGRTRAALGAAAGVLQVIRTDDPAPTDAG